MENKIVVKLNQGLVNQTIYIFTDKSEKLPIVEEVSMENLFTSITKAVSFYKIDKVHLCGAHSYTLGIKDQLTTKFQLCFGLDNNITIELT